MGTLNKSNIEDDSELHRNRFLSRFSGPERDVLMELFLSTQKKPHMRSSHATIEHDLNKPPTPEHLFDCLAAVGIYFTVVDGKLFAHSSSEKVTIVAAIISVLSQFTEFGTYVESSNVDFRVELEEDHLHIGSIQ